ncbi:MAG: quinone-dependent dihydroorotate dehydrogenase [Saprospiraceae bacterium]
MYQYLIKPILFLIDPEKAHHLVIKLMRIFLMIPGVRHLFVKLYRVDHPSLHQTIWGLDFPNPVGLAAGFDKDGKHFETMSALGFGFIEIGTVTPLPQDGNDKPRLFRLPDDEALINRMGFNNDGVDAMVRRLQSQKERSFIIGGNIGKNKVTPNDVADEDYIICFEKLYPYVDYFAVNVSSPNTPGLRALQGKEPLTKLLHSLKNINLTKPKPRPILLKIAPDLTPSQLDDIVSIVFDTSIDGVIATNTTIAREGMITDVATIGPGGLSGKPLRDQSTEVIRYLHQKSNGKIKIIAVGGIDSPEAALEKLKAGASLVQIYTGLVYKGPGLVKKINNAIVAANFFQL